MGCSVSPRRTRVLPSGPAIGAVSPMRATPRPRREPGDGGLQGGGNQPTDLLGGRLVGDPALDDEVGRRGAGSGEVVQPSTDATSRFSARRGSPPTGRWPPSRAAVGDAGAAGRTASVAPTRPDAHPDAQPGGPEIGRSSDRPPRTRPPRYRPAVLDPPADVRRTPTSRTSSTSSSTARPRRRRRRRPEPTTSDPGRDDRPRPAPTRRGGRAEAPRAARPGRIGTEARWPEGSGRPSRVTRAPTAPRSSSTGTNTARGWS